MILNYEHKPIEQTDKDRNLTDAIFHECLSAKKMPLAGLARKYSAEHPDKPTTAQNITNKIARDSLKLREFAEYLELIGFDVVLVPRGDSAPEEDHQSDGEENESVKAEDVIQSTPKRTKKEERKIEVEQESMIPLIEKDDDYIQNDIETTVPLQIDAERYVLLKGDRAKQAANAYRKKYMEYLQKTGIITDINKHKAYIQALLDFICIRYKVSITTANMEVM